MANITQQTLSLGAIATGDRHVPVHYKSVAGVALHPLQRMGAVSALPSMFTSFRPAASQPGLIDSYYPAAATPHRWPPVIPLAGSPRDPAMMV